MTTRFISKNRTRTRTRSRHLSPCYRHPSEPVTGFCALCLRERLTSLEAAVEPSSSTSEITSSVHQNGGDGGESRSELRRGKSVSIGRCEGSSCEPRRYSCDVRSMNTLSNLFNVDDECMGVNREIKVESKSLGFSRIDGKDLRAKNVNVNVKLDSVRFCEDVLVPDFGIGNEIEEDLKTMKEHIDLELRSSRSKLRDFKDIAGSFRVATSAFTKKLQKWRLKSNRKKVSGRDGEMVGNDGGRAGRETQSEVGEYGLWRKSCDTEPRFSVDANRISVDNVRFSFDEPTASWDGYLIARTIPRLTPMLSVGENMMLNTPEEQMHSIREDDTTSGLSAQSNSDSSTSHRRSIFDRTSSIRSASIKALGLEVDEAKVIANSKASPANSNVFSGSKLVITEKELKDWHLNSLKDDHSKSFDSVSKDATADALIGFKKLTRWKLAGNLWGFKNKLVDQKNENFVENASRNLVVERFKEENREVGLENAVSSGMLTRSSSCVTATNSCRTIPSDDGMNVLETGDCARKGAKEFVLDRNKSTKFYQSNVDNGLLRFYLTPFRSYRKSGSEKGRIKNSSIAGDVLRLN